jgi:hypothetical protein
MLIAAKTIVEVTKLNVLLSREFDLKDLGVPKNILGMEICKDKDAKRLWLSQANYVKKVLERFSMENAKPVSTPLANHFCLSTSQCPKTIEETEGMSKVPYADYAYADYAGDLDEKRSITSYLFTVTGGPICWRFIIQSTVDMSTTKMEYMAAAKAADECQILYI